MKRINLLKIFSRQSHCSSKNLDLAHCYKVLETLMPQACEVIADANKSQRVFTTKANAKDLVTKTDQAIEKLLISGIHEHYPEHRFIAEEETAVANDAKVLTDEPTWIIDPIDGTTNFVHGFPYYCISVGFWLNRVPEFGIVYNPALQQYYHAKRGMGAFLNDTQIRVSGQKNLSQALIIHELGVDMKRRHTILKNIESVLQQAHGMRSLGSVALDMCLIAQGACDGFYEFGAHIWDIGAAALIVREAGGVVLDPCGLELDVMSRRFLAAATPELGEELANTLKQLFPKPRDDERPKENNEEKI